MKESAPSLGTIFGDSKPIRQMRAWLLLVAVLATHVIDEAIADFLGFYNPLVLSIRSKMPSFPMPTFTFGVWLAGLSGLVVALALLAPLVRRGAVPSRVACWVLSTIMFMNGLGHLVGSAYFQRWLPGTTSAPLLLAASCVLAYATWDRQKRGSSSERHAV